jgi:hypothetical protein
MNISENEILNEIEKICIHRSKNRNAFRRLTLSKPMTYWDYIQTDALLYSNPKDFQMKWFYHVIK